MKPAFTFKEAEFWPDFIAELIHLEATESLGGYPGVDLARLTIL